MHANDSGLLLHPPTVPHPPRGIALPRWCCLLVVLGAFGLSTVPALAQPSASDRAAAEALFDQALELIQKNDYSTACPKLQESQRLDPGVGTLLYLADCYQQTGRTASAWATFKEAAYAAHNSGQTDREQIANEHAETLKPKLSYLVVRVDGASEGQQVELDGKAMNAALLGGPVPLDPGSHQLSARAPGKVDWSESVEIPAEAGETNIVVPALEDRPAPATTRTPPAEPTSTAVVPTTPATTAPQNDAPPAPRRTGNHQRTAGYMVGGAGLVGLSLSAVLAAGASAKDKQADDECLPNDPAQCSEEGVKLANEAKDRAKGATVTLVIGGAATATGIVLVVTAPRKRSKKTASTSLTLAPEIDPTKAVLVLKGGFR